MGDEAYRAQFTQRVLDARKRWGGTQAELAEALGISQPTYSKYETRRTLLPHRFIAQFCEVTGADPRELLGMPAERRQQS